MIDRLGDEGLTATCSMERSETGVEVFIGISGRIVIGDDSSMSGRIGTALGLGLGWMWIEFKACRAWVVRVLFGMEGGAGRGSSDSSEAKAVIAAWSIDEQH